MQHSKQLSQVLLKHKSLVDFQPKKILAPGEYEIVDPGRLVRIGNRQFQYVRGGWGWYNINWPYHPTPYCWGFKVEPGIKITQFKEDGKIDYIYFLTNSEYENQQTLKSQIEDHQCNSYCSCNNDIADHYRTYLVLKRAKVELYSDSNKRRMGYTGIFEGGKPDWQF